MVLGLVLGREGHGPSSGVTNREQAGREEEGRIPHVLSNQTGDMNPHSMCPHSMCPHSM